MPIATGNGLGIPYDRDDSGGGAPLGNILVFPTGSQCVSALGTVTVTGKASVPVTGNALASAFNSVTIFISNPITVNVTGNAAASANGSVIVDTSGIEIVNVTGQGAVSANGSVTVVTHTTVNLAGEAMTLANNSVTQMSNISAAVTGQGLTTANGSVTFKSNMPLPVTGNAATTAINGVTVVAGDPNLLDGISWTAGASTTLSTAGGRARATATSGATNPRIYKEVPGLTIGETYRIDTGTLYMGTTPGPQVFIRVSNDATIGAGGPYNASYITDQALDFTWVATQTTHWVGIVPVITLSGQYGEITDALNMVVD